MNAIATSAKGALKRWRAAFRGVAAMILFVIGATAQSLSIAQSTWIGSSPSRSQHYPSPTNLKVLPKSLTGSQVQTIMNQWNVELGVRCSACHQRDSDEVAPGGPPGPRFADDSKPMEQVARLMYTMTMEINRKYIVGQDNVAGPVTCGTCHGGSIRPEPFVAPRNSRRAVIQSAEPEQTPTPPSHR
jgi:hypothetical protein